MFPHLTNDLIYNNRFVLPNTPSSSKHSPCLSMGQQDAISGQSQPSSIYQITLAMDRSANVNHYHL